MIAPKVTGARRVFAKVALHCLDIHKSATDLTSLLEQSGWGSTPEVAAAFEQRLADVRATGVSTGSG